MIPDIDATRRESLVDGTVMREQLPGDGDTEPEDTADELADEVEVEHQATTDRKTVERLRHRLWVDVMSCRQRDVRAMLLVQGSE